MSQSLASYPCLDPETEKLRNSLLPLYQRLADIESGKREFGGFIEASELPKNFNMSVDEYPRLQMNFTQAELETLTDYAKLNAAELLAKVSTPLERLIIAVVWKNGDLQKVRHIAEGLGYGLGRSVVMDKNTPGPVFRQFGQHLAAPAQQPIADQHTLRAYRIHRDDCADDKAHLKDISTGSEIASYVAWVQKISGDQLSQDRLYGFDQSMFALGRATKKVLSSPHRKKSAKQPLATGGG
ncbi:hypothetical protein [Herbaspirillum sp. NPDC087042]|uniref:hypothetical protein n=1 Tax=Herbaspirillum sp. NPDC087042 TaxID=3364004 RepID=UPI00382B4F4A